MSVPPPATLIPFAARFCPMLPASPAVPTCSTPGLTFVPAVYVLPPFVRIVVPLPI